MKLAEASYPIVNPMTYFASSC